MEENKIPPKVEWPSLTIEQLLTVKSDLQTAYWNMKNIQASFANQYLMYIAQVETLINIKEMESQSEED